MGDFLHFYPHNNLKNQNFEKMKKPAGDIIILHMHTKNYDQMMYSFWDMVHDRCNCYFSFWAIFCPFTPLTAQKIKTLKKRKKSLEISSFYICVPKIMIRWCMVPEIWCAMDGQMDRWMDGQKKWHIEVGAPPKNYYYCLSLDTYLTLLNRKNINRKGKTYKILLQLNFIT